MGVSNNSRPRTVRAQAAIERRRAERLSDLGRRARGGDDHARDTAAHIQVARRRRLHPTPPLSPLSPHRLTASSPHHLTTSSHLSPPLHLISPHLTTSPPHHLSTSPHLMRPVRAPKRCISAHPSPCHRIAPSPLASPRHRARADGAPRLQGGVAPHADGHAAAEPAALAPRRGARARGPRRARPGVLTPPRLIPPHRTPPPPLLITSPPPRLTPSRAIRRSQLAAELRTARTSSPARDGDCS